MIILRMTFQRRKLWSWVSRWRWSSRPGDGLLAQTALKFIFKMIPSFRAPKPAVGVLAEILTCLIYMIIQQMSLTTTLHVRGNPVETGPYTVILENEHLEQGNRLSGSLSNIGQINHQSMNLMSLVRLIT